NLLIADQFNLRIRKVDIKNGIITTIAGNGIQGFSGDGGPAISAGLDTPSGVAIDTGGNLFIADSMNHRIRRMDAKTGNITTVAGSGMVGLGNGRFGGDGSLATSAFLDTPRG